MIYIHVCMVIYWKHKPCALEVWCYFVLLESSFKSCGGSRCDARDWDWSCWLMAGIICTGRRSCWQLAVWESCVCACLIRHPWSQMGDHDNSNTPQSLLVDPDYWVKPGTLSISVYMQKWGWASETLLSLTLLCKHLMTTVETDYCTCLTALAVGSATSCSTASFIMSTVVP